MKDDTDNERHEASPLEQLITSTPLESLDCSRNRWPRCGAFARSSGRACQAPGAGLGGRCRHHGGLTLGAVSRKRHWLRPAERAPVEPRKVVLVSAYEGLHAECHAPARDRRRWDMWAIPHELWALLPPEAASGAIGDVGHMRALLRESGVLNRTVSRWPQLIGFRIALRLAERGRIAFALMLDARDVKRATRAAVDCGNECVRRVEADELLSALRAAGGAVAKASKP